MEREAEDGRLVRELGQLAADLGPALMPAGRWDLLQSVASLAAVVFGARACSVALLDEAGEELRFEVSSRGPSTPLTAVVVGALGVMALSRLVPLAAAQFYLHSAAGILALWPLAHHMWRSPMPGAAAQPGRARAWHVPTT